MPNARAASDMDAEWQYQTIAQILGSWAGRPFTEREKTMFPLQVRSKRGSGLFYSFLISPGDRVQIDRARNTRSNGWRATVTLVSNTGPGSRRATVFEDHGWYCI